MRNAVPVAAAIFLMSCGLGARYPHFGEASYRIEGLTTPVNGGPATYTVIYRDGQKMRVEAMLPTLGQATIVYDESGAYVLNPTSVPTGASTTMTPTMPSAAPPPGSATALPSAHTPAANTPAPVAPTTTPAAGVAVRISNADAPQPLETAWEALGAENARSIGNCRVAGQRGHQWRPTKQAQGVKRLACITGDGIVLKVSENGRVLWEATSLQRGPQEAALFGVPAGYRRIDPQQLAEQVDRATALP